MVGRGRCALQLGISLHPTVLSRARWTSEAESRIRLTRSRGEESSEILMELTCNERSND